MLKDKLDLFNLFGFLPVSLISILDIAIVSFIFYRLMHLIRGTRASQMLLGFFLLVSVALAAPLLQMEAFAWLLDQVRSILLIMLVILFQAELRRMLVSLGQSQVMSWFYKKESNRVIDAVVAGAVQLSERGYGALIVLVREVGLGPIIESGVPLSAEVSADLLTTIFTPRSPLHDQAVVIQSETLVAARCTLPLAEEVEDERLGTRHLAALGLSQESDAVCVVVSEESRAISLAMGGELTRGLSAQQLKQRLTELMTRKEPKEAAAKKA